MFTKSSLLTFPITQITLSPALVNPEITFAASEPDMYIESFGCSGISSPSATTVIVKSVILFS